MRIRLCLAVIAIAASAYALLQAYRAAAAAGFCQMKVLRTPDERFAGLPDFPFVPRYSDVATETGTQR